MEFRKQISNTVKHFTFTTNIYIACYLGNCMCLINYTTKKKCNLWSTDWLYISDALIPGRLCKSCLGVITKLRNIVWHCAHIQREKIVQGQLSFC